MFRRPYSRLQSKSAVRHACLLDRLHEEAFRFTIVEFHDAGVGTLGFPVAALVHPAKTGFEEDFANKIVGEQSTGVSIPQQLDDEFRSQAFDLVIRNQEIVSV